MRLTRGNAAFQASEVLPGDNWNPTTWVFFPECEGMARYARTMRGLLPLPVEHVLSPHYPRPLPGPRLKRYVGGLCEKTFSAAFPVSIPPKANRTGYRGRKRPPLSKMRPSKLRSHL